MIDHVLGRPSSKFRKIQVFAVVSFWSLYLSRGDKHGPPALRRVSKRFQNLLTPWRSVVLTMLWLYISRNFAKIVGLESPEPLANLYSRSYFRATWITTALDAGFWTAMKIRKKWLRDFASIVFSVYYLIAAEQADEKVRKVRATLTVDHLRTSWNKSTTPYLHFVTSAIGPRLMQTKPRALRIARPPNSNYKDHVEAWLYFDGPLSALSQHTRVILDIPGGGFVAMGPPNHEEKLATWAAKTRLPVLSLDYRKAPEFPYPYALNECYDVYQAIIESRGRCIGLSGEVVPQIVVTGDSAGGNLATGLTLMILQAGGTDSRRWHGEQTLPTPTGLILTYPGLDMNIGNWMTDEQMSLIRERKARKTNRNILRRKSEDYYKLDPTSAHASDNEDEDTGSPTQYLPNESLVASPATERARLWTKPEPSAASVNQAEQAIQVENLVNPKPPQMKTRLAMSSKISYFNDRILTPEMMRAMIILYVGPHNRPDFSTDYLLSPLLAPEALLARFPKTYFLTGERDPLVDDTVIFAGRLRQAKQNNFRERQELGLEKSTAEFDEKDHVQVSLLPGLSHGFFQFVSIFPESKKLLERVARWVEDIFAEADSAALLNTAREHRYSITKDSRIASRRTQVRPAISAGGKAQNQLRTSSAFQRHHQRSLTGESSGDEDRPLEMSSIRPTFTDQLETSSSTSRPNYSSTPTSPVSPTNTRHIDRPRIRPLTVTSMRDKDTERDSARRSRLNRNHSLVTLASEEDLLGRRMHGLAGGLMGDGESRDEDRQ